MNNTISKLQKTINKDEALIFLNRANRFYITGLDTDVGAVIISKGKAYFFVDSRYITAAENRCTDLEIVQFGNMYEKIKDVLKCECINNAFFEQSVSLSQYNKINAELKTFNPDFSDRANKAVETLRQSKSEEEINNITTAQRICEKGLDHILPLIKPGVSERDLALELEFYIRKNGCTGVAFDFIVASGENSSMPHACVTNKKIQQGEFITFDFGGIINGYRSDMTRTLALGKPNEEMVRVYNTVLEAQNKALDNARAGLTGRHVDAFARDVIKNAGYGDYFGHALGHSVGVEIHEGPNFSPSNNGIMPVGAVVTVEPGIYIPNRFGVRIEDMIVLNENGCTNLTNYPKELITL